MVCQFGIIPARAGFTGRRGGMRDGRLDHPRSRGGYMVIMPSRRDAEGSSPLARGLPANTGLGMVGSRIIPARAGFTNDIVVVARPGEDHPRSRGVYRL